MSDHRSPLQSQTARLAGTVSRSRPPLPTVALTACLALSVSCDRTGEPGTPAAGRDGVPAIDPDEVPASSLVESDGLWRREGAAEPFTGRAVERYKDGQVAVQCDYDGGVIQSKVEWMKGGKKKSETRYRDGEAYFQTRWRSSDGSKKLETELKDGIPHGVHKRWHPNGQLGWVGEFYEGKWHGLVEDRDADGTLIIKGRYDRGKLVEDLLPEN